MLALFCVPMYIERKNHSASCYVVNLDRFFYRCVSTTYCGGVMFKEHYPAFAVVQVEQQPKKRKRTAYKNCGFHKASNEFVITNSLARGEPLDPRTEKGRDAAAFFRFLLGTKGTIACAQ